MVDYIFSLDYKYIYTEGVYYPVMIILLLFFWVGWPIQTIISYRKRYKNFIVSEYSSRPTLSELSIGSYIGWLIGSPFVALVGGFLWPLTIVLFILFIILTIQESIQSSYLFNNIPIFLVKDIIKKNAALGLTSKNQNVRKEFEKTLNKEKPNE